jgi:hypothetical protein
MSNTVSVFAATAKKVLIAVGFAAALGTVGTAVAGADPSSGSADSSSGVQCEHWGVQIPCQTGAVADTDGTQGNFRSATQGDARTGSQGDTRYGSQGITDDDGFQGAYAYGSAAAFPQYR